MSDPLKDAQTILETYLVKGGDKLRSCAHSAEFIESPVISFPIQISESQITGLELGTITNGFLETRWGRLSYKNLQEKNFLMACEASQTFAGQPIKQISQTKMTIPYINEAGKMLTISPAFYINYTQAVDVVNTVTMENRLRNFWIQEYIGNEQELLQIGFSYKLVLLEEQATHLEQARPSFHKIFMDFARTVAKRSVSQKLQVGSVITSLDSNIIFSFGYNGDEKGGSNKPVVDETGKHEDTVHAEYNSLLKLDFNMPQDKILYVTHSPCIKCARSIINANIKLVLFGEVYKDIIGVNLLRNRGVRTIQYS